MGARHDADDAPEAFRAAIASVRAALVRPEVSLDEAPAPQRLAPWALALTADVIVDDEEAATGRFVLLHDPAGHEAWQGTFRVVTFVRAELEPDLVGDPLLPGVGWAWLTEALEGRDVRYTAASGTVTRVASESFGAMADRSPTAELELRASWTAVPAGVGAEAAGRGGLVRSGEHVEAGTHLVAWTDLLCTVAGLPPVPAGVSVLPRRPRRR